MSVPDTEKGYVHGGSTGWWGAPSEEETPELQWPASISVYDRMRKQDPQITSVLRAVTLPIRRTSWRVDPNGCRPEVARHVADDLGLPLVGEDRVAFLRTRDRFSWPEHLQHALLKLSFGHAVFEQQYRLIDGLAHLRKLAYRPPRTIAEFKVARDGGLVSVFQYAGPGDTQRPELSVDRLVVYVNDREGANWTGTSLLRSAYKPWLLKDRALRTQSQSLDRNGMGIPVYEGAEHKLDGLDPAEQGRRQKDELDEGKKIATSLRAGDESGAATPHGAKLRLMGVEGDLPDADKPIRYHDEQIARAVLAHFLNLGTETGSWALGSTFADFFTLSLQTVAMAIQDVTNQHVIEDLVDANWGTEEPAPRLVFDEIGSRHPATAEAIKALLDSGALSADPGLEKHLRTIYGLPPKPDTAPASGAQQ